MSQVLPIKKEVKKQLPYGLETTADLLLEFMSKSKDEHQRDTAKFYRNYVCPGVIRGWAVLNRV